MLSLCAVGVSKRTLSRAASTAARADPRTYYYFVDTHGRLYLHDTKPRTIATCLKDNKFLDFFWKRLQMNSGQLVSATSFPYVSPCGAELNFVQCADTPWVSFLFVFPI
jgi:hypothetical protein